MKIGILSYWWSQDNYGQLLQCFALQYYLRKNGIDAFHIKYDSRNDLQQRSLFSYFLRLINPFALLSKISRKINKKNTVFIDRKFDDFRFSNIQFSNLYKTYDELKENPPEADIYIAGSDQIWNFYQYDLSQVKNQINAYFLNFGSSSVKRVSYAASWGKFTIKRNFIDFISPLIKKFDLVSVRENSGINLCEKCGIENSWLISDPTFLLSADEYRQLYKNNISNYVQKKYVLLYLLANTINFQIEKIYQWAKQEGLHVVYVTGNGRVDNYKKEYPTIYEWLYLIDNAEYVITNSFHCSVFSALFKRKFGVIPLTGKEKGMNDRFISLFKFLKIQPRFIESKDFSNLMKDINPKITSDITYINKIIHLGK